jgi:hypothetical protein
VTPVNRGLPRNWGQLSLAAGACASIGPTRTINHENTKITKTFQKDCFVLLVCFVVARLSPNIYFTARA